MPRQPVGALAAKGRTAQTERRARLLRANPPVRRPPADGRPRSASAGIALTVANARFGFCICLTFDMRGGRKQAKLACGRPLDRRVRELVHKALLNWPGREAVPAEASGVWLTVMNGSALRDRNRALLDTASTELRIGSGSCLTVRAKSPCAFEFDPCELDRGWCS